MALRFVVFETDGGWIGVLGSDFGLVRSTLPQPSAERARQLLGDGDAAAGPGLFDGLVGRFRAYFRGEKTVFTERLDLSRVSSFRRRVWAATRLIPYGTTRSYAWLAEQVGQPGAARAVGQALAANPLPIIVPCHRVLAVDGGLGGYSGGVEMKKLLLTAEAAGSIKVAK